MNNFLTKMSRRERLYVLFAAIVLFAGGILYPLFRASSSYRQEKLEELQTARNLRETYQTMLQTADQIRKENGELKEVAGKTDGLLFERVGNDVMMEASIVKMFNQMAPDLSLEVSQTRTKLHGVPGQMNFTVRGSGRYPEILNFFYLIETHRPLIVVDRFSMGTQSGRRSSDQGGGRSPNQIGGRSSDQGGGRSSDQGGGRSSDRGKKRFSSQRTTGSNEATEPRMKLSMEIHINCRTAGGGK